MKTIKKTLLLALVAFIILRLPSLFEPHWYADEGIYAAVTYGMEQGRQLYVNLWDNKPPVIYYLYSLGNPHNRLLVIKFLNLFAGLVTIVGLYELLKTLKFNEKIAGFALLLAVYMLGTPLIEGNIANAENFFLPLIVWSYVVILKVQTRHLIAGILLGIGFLFKFHPFFNLAAVAIYVGFVHKNIILDIRNLLKIFVGFLTPVIAQFTLLFFQGNLLPALDTIFLNNFDYTQSYSTGVHSLGLRTLILGTCVGLAIVLKKQGTISQRSFFLIIVGFFELYAAFFGGRRYYHYLIQTVPIATLGFGVLLEKMQKESLRNRLFYLLSSFGAVFFILKAFFSAEGFAFAYPVQDYYSQFGAYITNQQPYFIDHTERTLQKMRAALEHYPVGTTVYIYTTNPWIYDVLEIVPTVKIVASYHRTFIGMENFMQSVRKVNPDIIVVDARADKSEKFNQYVEEKYLPGEKIDYYQFWLKKFSIFQHIIINQP